MSKHSAMRQRPLSPHLSVYRLIPTMVMSILHRITGAALYFGTLLVAWWLLAASMSPEFFGRTAAIYGSWPGQLILFGYSWALLHHMLGGIRHLIWDTGRLLTRVESNMLAWATLIGSVTLTLLVWAAGYAMR